MDNSLNILEFLGIIGSLASIISIIINISQGLQNRSLKRQLSSVICSCEDSFSQIEKNAHECISSHAANRLSYLKSIAANAHATKRYLSEIRSRILNINLDIE